MRDASDGVSSLRRALLLLEQFTPEHPELSVRELARRADVPRSTTHRLVQELLSWGALEHGTGGVRLGVRLFELGTITPGQSTLHEASSAYLHTLNEVTRLTANLAIREGLNILYVEKISTANLRVPHSRLGGRGSLHATALGKAILAFSGPDAFAEITSGPLAAETPHTITDPDDLRRELAKVRHERVAYDVEESRPGLFCVAAPILDRRQSALAAVSVTGATERSQAERFASAVMATARSISRRLSDHPARSSAAMSPLAGNARS
jgi:DNA-binding IclR family transcriptional regulator